MLANFHRIAQIARHQGVEAHRRMLDRAAPVLRTGEAPPGSITITADEMRALIAERQAAQTRA